MYCELKSVGVSFLTTFGFNRALCIVNSNSFKFLSLNILCFNRALCIVNLQLSFDEYMSLPGFNRALCIVNGPKVTNCDGYKSVLIEHYVL